MHSEKSHNFRTILIISWNGLSHKRDNQPSHSDDHRSVRAPDDNRRTLLFVSKGA